MYVCIIHVCIICTYIIISVYDPDIASHVTQTYNKELQNEAISANRRVKKDTSDEIGIKLGLRMDRIWLWTRLEVDKW